MEDQKWLRLVTVGLVLAAVAVGYFLFIGRFSSNDSSKIKSQTDKSVPSAIPSASPSIKPIVSSVRPSPSPVLAYNRILERTTKGGGQPVDTLPRTGFPIIPTVLLLSSLMISGWGLRKFPH